MTLKSLLFSATALSAAAAPLAAATPADVVENYANIAHAGYEDSLILAKDLKTAIDAFVAEPGELTLHQAKAAWLRARVPYQQTEAFRFGNPLVDDWEGKVNAWPLDEGLIDYVKADHGLNEENPFAAANIIANPTLEISGQTIDATKITPELIESLHEIDGIEANVATGYHAIEFLLWGQDLYGTEHGAGERKATDYMSGDACTGGNCDRRAAYLTAATDLLVSDLEDMVALWAEDGQARKDVSADPQQGLVMAFTGIGSLSYGEQAGERMKLGLLINDPEEEHDCFADNTHNSHYYDGLGIKNVYTGRYVRVNGAVVEGPSLYDVVKEKDAALADALRSDMRHTMSALGAIKSTAEAGMSYDQMLGAQNPAGGALVQAAIDGLVAQTRNIERAVETVGLGKIELEGSDSLDNPGAVFE